MNNKIKELLLVLLGMIQNESLIKQISATGKFEGAEREKIFLLYNQMSQEEKKSLLEITEQTFFDMTQSHIFVLSIIFTVTLDEALLVEIANIAEKKNLDFDHRAFLEFQINRFCFLEGTYTVYEILRRLHKLLISRLMEDLNISYPYIAYEKRNKNRIVIVTGALLSIFHAPTKVILDQCYILQEKLGMEVLLIVSPLPEKEEFNTFWLRSFTVMSNPALNGNFSVIHMGTKINGIQVPITGAYYNQYKMIIKHIYDLKPMCVYSIGAYIRWEDILNQFTDVIVKDMSIRIPVSESNVLFYNEKAEYTGKEKALNYVRKSGQKLLNYNIKPILPKASSEYKREVFGYKEEDFIITLIGMRLNYEISKEFMDVLYRVLDINEKIKFMMIGEFDISKTERKYTNRFTHVEFQEDLAGIMKMVDLFMNPPRKGGGISALIALSNNVPVVTFSDNDVASNVGIDFISSNDNEMIETVKRYVEDEEFYKKQQQTGEQIINNGSKNHYGVETMFAHIEKLINT